jgi:pilus assembly protein TadC
MSPAARRTRTIARARSAAGSLSRQFAIAVGLAIAPVLVALVVFGW